MSAYEVNHQKLLFFVKHESYSRAGTDIEFKKTTGHIGRRSPYRLDCF